MTPRIRQHLELSTKRFYHGALLTRNRVTNSPGPHGRAAAAEKPALKPARGHRGLAEAQPR